MGTTAGESGMLVIRRRKQVRALESPVRQEVVDVGNELRSIRASRESVIQARGAIRDQVERLTQQAKELDTVQTDLARRERALTVYAELHRAFGRDGIPQLALSSAVPRLQEILTDLLAAFDRRWAIHIHTQRETKKGARVEAIDILVDDGLCVRDLSSYSGGERKVLKALLRIAFSALQAEQSGKRLAVAFWDEAFDAMDADNARRFIRVLHKLGSWFTQVFIVTHYDHLVLSVPNRIVFGTGANGATFEVVRDGAVPVEGRADLAEVIAS